VRWCVVLVSAAVLASSCSGSTVSTTIDSNSRCLERVNAELRDETVIMSQPEQIETTEGYVAELADFGDADSFEGIVKGSILPTRSGFIVTDRDPTSLEMFDLADGLDVYSEFCDPSVYVQTSIGRSRAPIIVVGGKIVLSKGPKVLVVGVGTPIGQRDPGDCLAVQSLTMDAGKLWDVVGWAKCDAIKGPESYIAKEKFGPIGSALIVSDSL
jgi:hypothetical protein